MSRSEDTRNACALGGRAGGGGLWKQNAFNEAFGENAVKLGRVNKLRVNHFPAGKGFTNHIASCGLPLIFKSAKYTLAAMASGIDVHQRYHIITW